MPPKPSKFKKAVVKKAPISTKESDTASESESSSSSSEAVKVISPKKQVKKQPTKAWEELADFELPKQDTSEHTLPETEKLVHDDDNNHDNQDNHDEHVIVVGQKSLEEKNEHVELGLGLGLELGREEHGGRGSYDGRGGRGGYRGSHHGGRGGNHGSHRGYRGGHGDNRGFRGERNSRGPRHNSVLNFDYNKVLNLTTGVNEVSTNDLLKIAIVRSHNAGQFQLCKVVKQTLQALNSECNWPETSDFRHNQPKQRTRQDQDQDHENQFD
jgi:hypothetical protein